MISGLPESTLRYYDKEGLLPFVERSGEYLKNRFDGTEGARRQMELLDAQALRLAAKAESIRMQQAYVSLKTLYWRAVAEGHDDEAQRLLEENHDVIETVKKQIRSKADA